MGLGKRAVSGHSFLEMPYKRKFTFFWAWVPFLSDQICKDLVIYNKKIEQFHTMLRHWSVSRLSGWRRYIGVELNHCICKPSPISWPNQFVYNMIIQSTPQNIERRSTVCSRKYQCKYFILIHSLEWDKHFL